MQKQHSRSQVIWYDAVTSEGKLTWQNSLNALNRRFFDASDAIFVNYAWKVTYICECQGYRASALSVNASCETLMTQTCCSKSFQKA